MPMPIIHLYRKPALTPRKEEALKGRFPSISSVESEFCYNVGLNEPLTVAELDALKWLLRETFEPEGFSQTPFLEGGRRFLLPYLRCPGRAP